MRTTVFSLLATTTLLAACSGGGGSSPGPAPTPTPDTDRFAEVDAAAEAAFLEEGIEGMGLAVYDSSGARVFQKMYGDFDADRAVAIASASKLVSGLVLFRLIEGGYLSLDSTTGEVLGWSGDAASISLRHLLSFTSGLPREHTCTLRADLTLEQCVDAIESEALVATPGSQFDYGGTHLHVAARMAEVQTGATWNEIFDAQLGEPLGVSELDYYTLPRVGSGTQNPMIAGGMRASMNDYARILRLVFEQGTHEGSALIDSELFALQRMEPYPDAAVGNTPLDFGDGSSHYGLTAWLECDTPDTGCDTISSPGAFGFTPWLDREAGYYAILGMEVGDSDSGVVAFAVNLKDELKPLIAAALAQ